MIRSCFFADNAISLCEGSGLDWSARLKTKLDSSYFDRFRTEIPKKEKRQKLAVVAVNLQKQVRVA